MIDDIVTAFIELALGLIVLACDVTVGIGFFFICGACWLFAADDDGD